MTKSEILNEARNLGIANNTNGFVELVMGYAFVVRNPKAAANIGRIEGVLIHRAFADGCRERISGNVA